MNIVNFHINHGKGEREKLCPKNGIKTYFSVYRECFLDFHIRIPFSLAVCCAAAAFEKKLYLSRIHIVCRVVARIAYIHCCMVHSTAARRALAQLSTLLCARYDIILIRCTLYRRHDINAMPLPSLCTAPANVCTHKRQSESEQGKQRKGKKCKKNIREKRATEKISKKKLQFLFISSYYFLLPFKLWHKPSRE